MQRLRRLWLSNFRKLRPWLSLLVLGFAFWAFGQLIILRILERTYQTPRYFITDTEPKGGFQQAVAVIQVNISNESNTSKAEVVFNDPGVESRRFQFALTRPEELEQAIAQELGMSLSEVRSLVQYKVQNQKL